jgi:hypothetical protein
MPVNNKPEMKVSGTLTDYPWTYMDKAAQHKLLLDWMTPLNFFQRQADIFSAWQPGTGEWLLSHQQFKEWVSGSGEIIWCPGMRMFFLGPYPWFVLTLFFF